MLRRLDVAMVMLHRPAVLFLDEPTTGLDPQGRADLWAAISGLAGENGTTILVTTHYLEEADKFADGVAIVDQGRIVAQGTPDELKSGLHGDSVVLELADPAHVGPARQALGGVAEIRGFSTEGGVLRARVADGPKALPAVLAGLDAVAVPVRSVTIARPSLDEVYLHHAGRSFRHAEGVTIS
jgi:ABC-2 type transport system ATP-binding protein